MSWMEILKTFPHAIAAGVLVAAVSAMFGVLVILKRVVFIGITLSETAACGVAAALWLQLPPLAGALALTLAAVAVLAVPYESHRIPRDAVLGVLFVLASSLSILLVSHSGFGLHDVKALLYGDLILASDRHLRTVALVTVPAGAGLLVCFRPVLYSFLDRDAAQVLGLRPRVWELAFFLTLGIVIATASEVAGTLLVFCYLVVAPATALLLSRRIGVVLLCAAAAAVGATLAGTAAAVHWDMPVNQTIVVTAVVAFLLVQVGVSAMVIAQRLRQAQPTQQGRGDAPGPGPGAGAATRP